MMMDEPNGNGKVQISVNGSNAEVQTTIVDLRAQIKSVLYESVETVRVTRRGRKGNEANRHRC